MTLLTSTPWTLAIVGLCALTTLIAVASGVGYALRRDPPPALPLLALGLLPALLLVLQAGADLEGGGHALGGLRQAQPGRWLWLLDLGALPLLVGAVVSGLRAPGWSWRRPLLLGVLAAALPALLLLVDLLALAGIPVCGEALCTPGALTENTVGRVLSAAVALLGAALLSLSQVSADRSAPSVSAANTAAMTAPLTLLVALQSHAHLLGPLGFGAGVAALVFTAATLQVPERDRTVAATRSEPGLLTAFLALALLAGAQA